MHGRPRKSPTPEDEKAYSIKATKLRSLQSQFLHFHHNKIYTKEALEISGKLLEVNPEHYTAWNYRKLAVIHNLTQSDDSEFVKSVFAQELTLVENALKRNYKSYGAWHHRKWVLSKGHSSTDRELRLLNLFQKQDTRNFHAWNYRRYIAALQNIPYKEELQFTTDMINDNFSNYSAWHNRSVLLSHLLKERVQGYYPKENVLAEEYEFVRNALFTDPADQSGWFYHLWLLDQTVKLETPILLSSWPPHGSNLNVPTDHPLDDCSLYSLTSFQSKTGAFPIVLHFSEAVEGVNSSTVTVEAEFDPNINLTWSPLSTNSCGCAQAWVTHINFPNDKLYSSKACSVKVSLGNSQGITSSSGIHFSHPSCIAFTVGAPPLESQQDEEYFPEQILWKDENFCMYETHEQEASPLNLFYQWRIKEDNKPATSQWSFETIANEISQYRELLSWTDCKIGKLTLARLLVAHDAMLSFNNPNSQSVDYEEILELYRDLMKLDPPHSQFYIDEYSLVLLKQVSSSCPSLLGYCHQYRESTSLRSNNPICLRLNNLSLSRIGSVERLLWVQMLDLSHNQIRSIEGLEAMQLLSCLNLSFNRICSFTALDPLRLVKSLKVLDISHNEIGAHTVDTKRYLCASPLSHTAGTDWKFEDFAITGIEISNYWEAFSVFRGLDLTQLDIVENPVASEEFKLFVPKLLPGLKWLDGEELH